MPRRDAHIGPSLAVVIPVRDRAELLRRALDSVVHQHRPGVQLVVVDDGSDPAVDHTILPPAVGRVIRVDGVGVSSARNAGVAAAADAAWITFLDSDDEASAGWIDSMLRAQAGSAALFSCGARYDREDGSEELSVPAPMWSAPSAPRALFLAGTFAVDRSVFLRAGGYRAGLRHGENTDLGWRLAAVVRQDALVCVAVDEPLVLVHAVRRPHDAAMRLESALAVLADPPELLVADRRMHATYFAIAGVEASRLGDRRTAVSMLGRAVRTYPREPRHVARLVRALVGRQCTLRSIDAQ